MAESKRDRVKREADERIKWAYDSIPAQYHPYIVLIDRNIKIGEKEWVRVQNPYIGADGRVMLAIDDANTTGGRLNIETEFITMPDGAIACKARVKCIMGEATAHAQAFIGGSGVDKTNPYENSECVPITTQILTRDGFKYYHQLKPGMGVLTHNVKTGLNEWQPLLKVSVYNQNPIVRVFNNNGFQVDCTPDHKWVVKNHNNDGELTPQIDIPYDKGNYRILMCAAEEDTSPMGDVFNAERLAWLFTDGQLRHTSGIISSAEVRQSKEENLGDLIRLFGSSYRSPKNYNPNWKQSYAWQIPAATVRDICGPFGVNSYSDLPKALCLMTPSEVRGFYNAAMAADGYDHAIGKSKPKLIESMQIACARLGIRTNSVTTKDNMKMQTKPFYILNIQKTTGPYTSNLQVKRLGTKPVWCPTTANGTWIARQPNGAVFITGNTSAVSRALGYLGYGLFGVGIASAEDVQSAIAKGGDVARQNPEMWREMDDAPGAKQPRGKIEVGPARQATRDLFKSENFQSPELRRAVAKVLYCAELGQMDSLSEDVFAEILPRLQYVNGIIDEFGYTGTDYESWLEMVCNGEGEELEPDGTPIEQLQRYIALGCDLMEGDELDEEQKRELGTEIEVWNVWVNKPSVPDDVMQRMLAKAKELIG